MNSPDLKKLITAFLLLSVVTTSSVLFFSTFSNTLSSPADVASKKNSEDSALIKENAFANLAQEDPLFSQKNPIENDLLLPSNSSNLTENLIRGLARELVAANPTGPQILRGQQSVLPPNGATLETLLNQNAADVDAKDFQGVLKDEEVKIKANYTPEDITAYFKVTNTILANTVSGPRYKGLENQEPSEGMLLAIGLIFDEATQQLKNLSVPKPLTEFHKKLLVSLINQQNIFEVLGNYQNDPVKTLLVENVADQIIDYDFENFLNESKNIRQIEKAAILKKSFWSPLSFLKNFFSAKTATAADLSGDGGGEETSSSGAAQNVVPTDCNGEKCTEFYAKETGNTSKTLKQKFKEFARKLATEILKNQIIHRLVQQIIKWVQGGGKPQFVTNWKEFLEDTADQAAGSLIQQIYPQLCTSFSPLIRAAILPIKNVPSNQVSCTLDKVVANVTDFYNDFRAGDWIGYTTALRPENNLFGGIVQVSDIVTIEAAKAREAADSDAKASRGYLSPKICVREVPEQRVASDWDPDLNNGAGGLTYTTTPARCDEWEATTPGGLVADVTKKAVADSPLDQIVNVQDLEALVAALVDSFLNKMITSKGGLTGTSNSNNKRTQPGKNSNYDPCDGLKGASYDECQNSLNIGDPPPPKKPKPSNSTSTPPEICTANGDPECSSLSPIDPLYKECIATCY